MSIDQLAEYDPRKSLQRCGNARENSRKNLSASSRIARTARTDTDQQTYHNQDKCFHSQLSLRISSGLGIRFRIQAIPLRSKPLIKCLLVYRQGEFRMLNVDLPAFGTFKSDAMR